MMNPLMCIYNMDPAMYHMHPHFSPSSDFGTTDMGTAWTTTDAGSLACVTDTGMSSCY